MNRVAIVGAGLCGRLLALVLLKAGWHVTLFERDQFAQPSSSCAYTAAGMLALCVELEQATPLIYALGLRSLVLWPALLALLSAPVTFVQQGSLLLAHHQDRQQLRHFIARLLAKGHSTQAFQALDKAAINQLEPGLTAAVGVDGYFFPKEAYLDSQVWFDAVGQALLDCQWHWGVTVNDVQPHQVICDKVSFDFDWVFDCRGLGAKVQRPMLRGVRGELLWLHAPHITLTRPVRLLHPRYRVYVVPRSHHRYIIGASELETEDMSPISVQTTLELLTAVYSVLPAFSEARIIHTAINCRPALPNNLPSIWSRRGLSTINGLYRHGYLIGPALVEQALADLGIDLTKYVNQLPASSFHDALSVQLKEVIQYD